MPDMSLLQFIGHVGRFDYRLRELQERGMEHVAKIVEAEAKRELGTYQRGNNGPFADWAELADRTKDERVQLDYAENEPGLREGDMRDSINHVSDRENAVVGSDDDKMVWFECGTTHQPPRSVLGVAVVHKEREIVDILGKAVVTALVGRNVFPGGIPIKGP